MSMWMLTEERKNELLKQRDSKLAELETLRKKTPSNLWREDLDVFLEKLEVVETKERNEQNSNPGDSKVKESKKTLLVCNNVRYCWRNINMLIFFLGS